MTATTTYTCDGCGEEIPRFAWRKQLTVRIDTTLVDFHFDQDCWTALANDRPAAEALRVVFSNETKVLRDLRRNDLVPASSKER